MFRIITKEFFDMKHYVHKNRGTCSVQVEFDLDDQGKLHNVKFVSGCDGNLKAISKLVEGADANEVAERLKGNTCGFRPTSCADQLAHGILEAIAD